MIRHSLTPLVSLLALAACAATREPAAPVATGTAPAEQLIYRARLAEVPAGAAQCRVAIRWPDDGPTEALRAVAAFGLVGNAAFELALDPSERATLAGEHAQLAWNEREEGGVSVRELVVETRGKPVELELRLARPAGAPLEVRELEDALARGTSATADGRALAEIATSLERPDPER